MSWFTEFAGKAEDFLNKIDQNAAVALNTGNEKESQKPRKTEPFLEPSKEVNSNFRSSGEPPVVQTGGNVVNGTSSSSHADHRNDSRRSGSKRQQSRSKSGASNRSSSAAIPSGASNTVSSQVSSGSVNASSSGSKAKINQNSSKSASQPKAASDPSNEEELIAYLNSNESSTELNESVILKGEVESQARELKLLTSNHRSLQKEHEELKQKLAIYEEKLENLESNRQSNETEEQDLQKLLEEKDLEIVSLTSRHEQALDALQKLELSQENLQKLEQCLLENSHLKTENSDLLQRTEVLSQKAETADNHVLSMKSTLSSMEKEFSNYKDKAKSILNYKDELIASLKSDGGSAESMESNTNNAEELFAEVTALKNERELLQADLSQTRAIVESLKEDNNRLEKEISTLRYYSEELSNHLKKEKETVGNLQNENLQVCQQLTSLQFDLDRERNERRKSEELVSKFKNPQNGPSGNNLNQSNSSQNGYLNSSSNSDKEVLKLKTRLSALSQSLLEKQSLINDISTDKQLLQIEVERLKNELRESRIEANEYGHVSGLPQTVIASQPLYLSESPWDSRVSARMKRIYTQLDAVFCQVGFALRKRPNLRFGMSLYVIFLHLWVFFVLFSWMHNTAPVAK